MLFPKNIAKLSSKDEILEAIDKPAKIEIF